MKMLMALSIKYKFYLFIIFAAILAGLPLLHPGLIPTHDGEYHLIRFYEFDKVLRSDTWYPRWAPDLYFGFGIPLFTYVYPLPNYVASFLHLFGVSFLDSVKLNMFLAGLVGAVGCFAWAKQFWGEKGGLISAIFYTFAPYHFVDVYVRGSVGEVWALALFPCFLWAYTLFFQTNKKYFFILSSLFLALIIFSHNILGLMFFTFALSYCLLLILQSKNTVCIIRNTVYIILLSLGLSSIFWLPALLEIKYVTGLQVYTVAQNFTDFFLLFFPSWGTGFYGTSLDNQMSVQIGLANLLGVFFSVIVWITLLKKKGKAFWLIGFFLGWFVLLFYLMLPASLPVWQHLPLLNYFQFPWRLLSLMILVCAFLAGSSTIFNKSWVPVFILCGFAILTTYSYTHPAYYMLRNDTYYTTRSNFIDSTNSPGNVFNTTWQTTQTKKTPSPFPIKQQTPTTWRATLMLTQPTTLVAHLSYFPTWQVVDNGKLVKTFSSKGNLSFSLAKGKHVITISQTQTPIENTAMILSIGSCLILLIL